MTTFGLGQLEKSLAEYREAVRLTPTVAGYSNLMGADLSLNLLDEAKAAYDEACARSWMAGTSAKLFTGLLF